MFGCVGINNIYTIVSILVHSRNTGSEPELIIIPYFNVSDQSDCSIRGLINHL